MHPLCFISLNYTFSCNFPPFYSYILVSFLHLPFMVLNLSFWNRINSFPPPHLLPFPSLTPPPSHLKFLQPSNFIFILDLCPFQSKNKIFNLNRNFLAEGLFTFFPSIRSWCYLLGYPVFCSFSQNTPHPLDNILDSSTFISPALFIFNCSLSIHTVSHKKYSENQKLQNMKTTFRLKLCLSTVIYKKLRNMKTTLRLKLLL